MMHSFPSVNFHGLSLTFPDSIAGMSHIFPSVSSAPQDGFTDSTGVGATWQAVPGERPVRCGCSVRRADASPAPPLAPKA